MKFLQRKPVVLFALGSVMFLAVAWWIFGYAPQGELATSGIAAPPAGMTDPFELGEYYFNAGDNPSGAHDLTKARMYYEQAVAASSTAHETAWHQLGRIDFIEGRFDSAIAKFNTQIELFGDLVPNVYYMIGLTYGYKAQLTENEEDWRRGEEAFEIFIEHSPMAPWPRIDLAWLQFEQGKYEEMLLVLSEGLNYAPENPWLHNMYGLALMNTGERAGARTHFELAENYANELTVEEWGKAYPGNDPEAWEIGLASFKEAIRKNLELASE
jgi:tetratricopeptide (TPR) repeat protein